MKHHDPSGKTTNGQAADAVRSPGIAAAQLQATIPKPEVTAAGWALHGHVFNADLQPVSKFIVSLTDESKKTQSQFGSSYTDDTGYFLLSYQKSSSSERLFVEVANQSGKAVYLATTPVQPVPGSAAYQTIVLPAGD